MVLTENVDGVILTGGSSRRMGRDKSLLQINGSSFIRHISEILKSIFKNVIISTDQPDKYQDLDLPIAVDIFTNAGPLAGIHASLTLSSSQYIFVTPCDIPLISTEIVNYILREAIPEKINIISDGNNSLPLCGIYPLSLLSPLNQFLTDGKRKVFDLLNSNFIEYHIINLSQFNGFLKNINTQEEYNKIL